MDFFFLYNALFYLYWYVYFLLRMRVVRCVMRQYFVSRNSRTKSKETPSLNRDEASPPPPLRMERGVDSIIYKQRGRFFDMKEASLRCNGTPSSKRRRRLFVFSSAVPANEVLPRYTETILHGHLCKALLQTKLIIILNCEL